MERCGITHRTIPQRQAPQRWTCCTRTHPTALFVRAYNEQGTIDSQLSLKDISGWLHTKEKLLDRVLAADIRADSRQLTASQVPLKDLSACLLRKQRCAGKICRQRGVDCNLTAGDYRSSSSVGHARVLVHPSGS